MSQIYSAVPLPISQVLGKAVRQRGEVSLTTSWPLFGFLIELNILSVRKQEQKIFVNLNRSKILLLLLLY